METLSSFRDVRSQSWLTWFYKGLLLLGLLILLTRLFELQIIKGAYYRELSDNNRIRRVPIKAPRGKIYARGGETIVGNKEEKLTVSFNPKSGFEKVPVEKGTPEDEVFIEYQRIYELAEAASHITGYLGVINEDEVGKIDPRCPEKGAYALNSLAGRTGLEQQYECTLRGIDGEELVEVDTRGRRVRTLGRKPPLPGSDITTNIDINFQKKVAEIVRDSEDIPIERKVAAVVTDTKGQVMAFYSSPSYDPNIFVDRKANQDIISSILNDEDLPLFNRVSGGAYPPGSIYKIVTSLAALEEDVIDKDYEYEDTGIVTVDDFSYTNWYFTQYGGVEGLIDLPKALARSTDTFFYEVGELMGVDNLVKWTRKLGLGEKTGIDLPGEISGLVPSPEWKKAVKGERWYLGNTYHMAIGQGDLTATPLELNKMVSVVASDGELCIPRLVGQGDCKSIDISKANLDLVRAGMVGACSEGGTAFPFFDFQVAGLEGRQVACKTGTAETFEEDVTHAWFSVFSPLDDPEIVMTVLVEKGGEGSKNAAPLARSIFDYWQLTKNP